MGKKRVDQYNQANSLHGDNHHHQEESQLLHKLNTHFKKLSKTRSRISPSSLDHHHHRIPTASSIPSINAVTAMHACYGSPMSSSSSAKVFDYTDDHNNNNYYYDHNGHRHAAVDNDAAAALKFGQLDYCCSGESDTGTTASFSVTMEENADLFGGENAFAPDLSAGHNLLHVGFVEEDKNGYRIGLRRGSYYLKDDPISTIDDGNTKYSLLDMLELSSQEEMIQEFLKANLFN